MTHAWQTHRQHLKHTESAMYLNHRGRSYLPSTTYVQKRNAWSQILRSSRCTATVRTHPDRHTTEHYQALHIHSYGSKRNDPKIPGLSHKGRDKFEGCLHPEKAESTYRLLDGTYRYLQVLISRYQWTRTSSRESAGAPNTKEQRTYAPTDPWHKEIKEPSSFAINLKMSHGYHRSRRRCLLLASNRGYTIHSRCPEFQQWRSLDSYASRSPGSSNPQRG